MSTKSRLQAMTAELVIPEGNPVNTPFNPSSSQPLETRFPPVAPRVPGAKTGPGQMLVFLGQKMEVEGEITTLRARLEQYADSMPTKKIDPDLVVPSRWANRHPASFTSPNFIRLKEDINVANGNVQPILVRPLNGSPGKFEIVFGHRRHLACKELEIPVLASICTEPLSDSELFSAMDRENRERADLSSYEQGIMYQRALDDGLYSSKRKLAEELGVSHTWINKALSVANLPVPIVECFKSPLEIQFRHADLLAKALEKDSKQVLKRAEKLRGKSMSASAVLSGLLESSHTKSSSQMRTVTVQGKKLGTIERKGDTVVVNLNGSDLGEEKLASLQTFLEGLLSNSEAK